MQRYLFALLVVGSLLMLGSVSLVKGYQAFLLSREAHDTPTADNLDRYFLVESRPPVALD